MYNFPNAPTVGQVFGNYTWDGQKWTSGTGYGAIYISDTAPPNAPSGSLWWQSNTGNLFVNYNDGNSTQWVAIGSGTGGGASSGVVSYNTLTGTVVVPAADRRIYVSVSGNDANTGLSPEGPKLTLQAAINAASPNGTVYAGIGTFTLSASLLMQPGVQLIGMIGTNIIMGPSMVTPFIDFQTNVANSAAIKFCQINGNRAAYAENPNVSLIFIGTANNVTIENCSIINTSGIAVNVTDGGKPVIRNNDFQNIGCVSIASGSNNNPSTYGKYNSNTFSNNLGQHVVYIYKSSGNEINDNLMYATQLRGTCNVSGSIVTWTGGQNFAGLQPGGFCIFSPGGSFTEGYILAVNSPTQLTIRETPPAANGIAFVIGTGDIVNIGNCAGNRVSRNRIYYGASGAIVLHNFYGGASLYETLVQDNMIWYCGGSGISIQGTSTAPVTYSASTQIQNNWIISCGQGGAAVGLLGQNAISMIDYAPPTVGSVVIGGNRMENEGGNATMQWGVYNSGAQSGQYFITPNYYFGIANPGGT